MVEFNNRMEFSESFFKLFNKKEYEKHVLEIMNASRKMFPETYIMKEEQSHGECDYIGMFTGKKYDAKVPFLHNQIEMLIGGKKHEPKIIEWVNELYDEAAEYNPLQLRDNPEYQIFNMKLYRIMRNQILRDKDDENIVFFIPFPVVMTEPHSIFEQFESDYLKAIYAELKKETKLLNRDVFVIFPSIIKNVFAIRNMRYGTTEYIPYAGMQYYFSYEASL